MTPAIPQLPLAIARVEGPGFDNFVVGQNAQAVADLQAAALGKGEQFLYLWGEAGSGRSHLLQAALRAAVEAGRFGRYVGLESKSKAFGAVSSESGTPKAALLDSWEGLEEFDLVCLDDIHLLAGDSEGERALFGLFNRLRERGATLIATADAPPQGLPVKLPDLASRLAWGLTHPLLPLTDPEKEQALIAGAARRGMELTGDAARYLLRHAPRDLSWLFGFMDRLDRATLAAQRRPTVRFIRELLVGSDRFSDQ